MEAANLPLSTKQKMLGFLQQEKSRCMRLRRQKMNKDMFEVLQHIRGRSFQSCFIVKKLDAPYNIVVSGSMDTTIRVWDLAKGTCVLSGHHSLTSGMQLRGDILVSRNGDSDVRVWNIRDGSCIYRLRGPNGHMSVITSLQFLDNGIVITSGNDGAVKLWDVMKGEFIRDLVRFLSGGSGDCIWRLKATK